MAYSECAPCSPPLPPGLPAIVDLRREVVRLSDCQAGALAAWERTPQAAWEVVVTWHEGRLMLASGREVIWLARSRGVGDLPCLVEVEGGVRHASAALV